MLTLQKCLPETTDLVITSSSYPVAVARNKLYLSVGFAACAHRVLETLMGCPSRSCVAYVNEKGQAVVIKSKEGDRTMASVVGFTKLGRTVGKSAKTNVWTLTRPLRIR